MPATPYFITAQIALIAVSASVVKLDLTKSHPVPKATAIPMSLTPPVDPSILEKASVPTAGVARFAPAETLDENESIESPQSAIRPMGFSDREMGMDSADAFSLPKTHANVAPSDSPPPVFDPIPASAGYHIASDAATNFDLKTNTVVFSGSVTLKCTDFILHSDRLVAHMTKGPSQTLSKLVANGNVDFHMTGVPKEEAYRGNGEQAVFDPATGIIVMSGWPRIIGHGREHNAASATTVMTLNTKSPKLETEGRAQTRLLMEGENGMPNLTMGGSTPAAPRQN